MLFKKFLFTSTICSLTFGWAATTQQLKEIDQKVEEALATFEVPGAAFALIDEGQVVFVKGYGVRDQKKNLPVTEETLFPIGSCTKAFTSLLIGKLVEEGKLQWDDPIITHIPEFRLKDPIATHKVTIRDALAHRSGLNRHDLVWYNSSASRQEIMERLAHLELSADPHEKFQYNNMMYATVGILLERVTGKSWEVLVKEEILSPLEMNRTQAVHNQSEQNFSLPYAKTEKGIEEIPFRNVDNMGPAGSIESSASEMARWALFQLNLAPALKEMHTMQIGFPVYPEGKIHTFGYGLGWMVGHYRGEYWVEHSGGIDGFCSRVSLLPEKKIALVLLTNSTPSGHYFNDSVTKTVQDILLGGETEDWIGTTRESLDKQMAQEPAPQVEVAMLREIDEYLGTYEHPGYGKVVIGEENGTLKLTFNGMSTHIQPKKGDLFVSRKEGDPVLSAMPLTFAFLSSAEGEIESLSIPFDLSCEPVLFKKMATPVPQNRLLQYAGKYRSEEMDVVIELKGSKLTLIVPGQGVFTLLPAQGEKFAIEGLNGFFLTFEETGVTFNQPNGDFFFTAVSE